MRNIAAEKKLIETLYFYGGAMIFLGVIVGAVGAELWLIFNFSTLTLPVFLVLQGLWLVVFGALLSVLTAASARTLNF